MELWNKARSIAEEAAKRSQDLTLGTSKLSNIISETSKEIAAQASKRADQLRAEAIKRADQIKLLAEGATTAGPITALSHPNDLHLDLEAYGITEELREFVTGITVTTFKDFPLQDDTEVFDVPAVSNVRQDLTEWQEKHASLVLSTVKEISRLRYELCPRFMKERKFWRIYFILVNNHVAPYENRYMEDAKLKSSEQVKDHKVMEPLDVELTANQEVQYAKLKSSEQVEDNKVTGPLEVGSTSSQGVQEAGKETKISTSITEQDLDQFLLGDSDDDQDNGDGDLDDDLDKLVDSSDDEKGKS